MKSSFLVVLLLIFSCTAFCQEKEENPLLDSLLAELPKAKEDTNKVNLLKKISFEYHNIEPKQGVFYANQGISLAEKLHFRRGMAACLNTRGVNEARQNNNSIALEYFLKALRIHEELGDKRSMEILLRNIAEIYDELSNDSKELEYLSKAIVINESLGDKKNMAKNLGAIGLIYYDQSNFPKAMEYHLKALKINEAIGNKKGIQGNYINIGNIYYYQLDYKKVIEYYTKAFSLAESLGDKSTLAEMSVNLGNVCYKDSNYPKALEYYNKAANQFEKLGSKGGMATAIGNTGKVYESLADFSKAKAYYTQALGICEEMNDRDGIARNIECLGMVYMKMAKEDGLQASTKKELILKSINSIDSATKIYKSISALHEYEISQLDLSEAYEMNGQYDNALIAFKEHVQYKDSVFNEEKTKEITQKELDYTYSKREDSIKLEQQKKDLAHEKELALKAIQFEYQKKQAAAKSEKEKQQLRFEQQLKEQQIEFEYNQKIIASETEKKNQLALNKVLSSENQLMAKNNENERKIRWLMIAALLGLIGFGINYYRSYQRQRADNQVIVKQSGELQVLMQEIHHRVKNNLQLISSLLELQSLKLTDSAAKSAFEEGQSRVQSIAILHQQLYQHDDLSVIELGTFSKELIRQITDVFKKPKQKIAVKYHIPETFFDIDTALPLGLILNELATNSFKYAHPATDSDGVEALALEISFSKNNDGNYALVFKDNGNGLPAGFDIVKSNSLGLRIVNRLVKQIKGQYQYAFDRGSVFTITFPSA